MSSPTPLDVASLDQAVAAGRKAIAVDAVMLTKLTELAGEFAVNLTIAILIFVATLFAAKWAAGAARRALSRVRGFRHDPTVLSFAVQVVRVVVVIVGMIAVLQRLGVQTTSIIAVLGAASLAVGLALQGTLSNVASGIMLLVLRPYRVGDVVDVGGMSGTVQRLDLFTTQLSNANNHKIVIPNSKVLSDPLTNLTGQQTRRIEIHFTVGYGDDLNRARQVLAGVAAAHDKVLDDPKPWTGVTALLDSAVQVTLHAWVKVGDWWQTQADLMQGGKEALDAAGIEIPFPHQVAVPYGDARDDPRGVSSRPEDKTV
ncbi:mechanosensitive ion channel family protein [Brevundimonas sp. SORGH_AS_0993]|uniref:mechanosensitive ion channel family protein n=1 Tax=Brevundimonas sp. SORGH_AS_0993 TaxID=3041794 RepID=UPI0027820512|nr:mechanosensitive ion channel family protein [Brevundimonas sp. SORGH_AS_0993]MDQ1153865.1 small conductance mechanosensitive channel [Brevundimonas sp. SORGH_AS_0993]